MEDNPDHALLVQLAAARVDARLDVRVCADGQEAVDLLSGVPPFDDRTQHPMPDLVLLDLIMPRLDGFGVLTWVRQQPHLKKLPVIVLTSSISPLDETRALRLGASGFYTKPADLQELGEQVHSIVKRWLS